MIFFNHQMFIYSKYGHLAKAEFSIDVQYKMRDIQNKNSVRKQWLTIDRISARSVARILSDLSHSGCLGNSMRGPLFWYNPPMEEFSLSWPMMPIWLILNNCQQCFYKVNSGQRVKSIIGRPLLNRLDRIITCISIRGININWKWLHFLKGWHLSTFPVNECLEKLCLKRCPNDILYMHLKHKFSQSGCF